jgi:hypothetical protein
MTVETGIGGDGEDRAGTVGYNSHRSTSSGSNSARYQMVPGLNLGQFATSTMSSGWYLVDSARADMCYAVSVTSWHYSFVGSSVAQIPYCLEVQPGGYGMVQAGAAGASAMQGNHQRHAHDLPLTACSYW